MGVFWRTGGTSTIVGLLVTVVLISCEVVFSSPVPQGNIHAVKPCNADCQQKIMGNPFEVYPAIKEGIGPTFIDPNPNSHSETLKEKPDTTVEKKLSDTYDIGLYSTICWTQITTVTEYLNGTEPITITEYAISFETPSNIPDKYAENLEKNNNAFVNTRRSFTVPFQTVERSQTSIIKQSRNVTCGSGPLYTKEILVWPTKNKTRLEIRVSPKAKSLAVDCSETTEPANSFSPRLLQDETTTVPLTTVPSLEEEAKSSGTGTNVDADKHIETTFNIVKNILDTQKTTTLSPEYIEKEKENLDKDKVIQDITNVVVAQTTPISLRTLPNEVIQKEDAPDNKDVTPLTYVHNQNPDDGDHVEDTEKLIKHIVGIIATEVSILSTTESPINTRISPDIPETTITPAETNTEEYEYEDESCEDVEENTQTASEESLSTLPSTSDDFAKAILKEAKKSKPNANILENLGTVDKNPEKQKLIENITMEILHDLLTSNSSETSTTKSDETYVSVPETRMDNFDITTTQIPTTNEPEKKSPEELISLIIKEIAHQNGTDNISGTPHHKNIIHNPNEKESGEMIANRVTAALGEDIPNIPVVGHTSPSIHELKGPGQKISFRKKPKQKSTDLITPGNTESSEEIITEILDENEPKILRNNAPKAVSSEEHVSDEIVTEIIDESTEKTELTKNISKTHESVSKPLEGEKYISTAIPQLETRMASDVTTDAADIVKHTTTLPDFKTEQTKDKSILNNQESGNILSIRTTPDHKGQTSIDHIEESTDGGLLIADKKNTSKTGEKIIGNKQPNEKLTTVIPTTPSDSMEEVTEIIEMDSEEHTMKEKEIMTSRIENSVDESFKKKSFQETTENPLEYTTLHILTRTNTDSELDSEEYDEITEIIDDSKETSTTHNGHVMKKNKKRKKKPASLDIDSISATVQPSIATRIGLTESSRTTTIIPEMSTVLIIEEKTDKISTRFDNYDTVTTNQPKSTETYEDTTEYIDITSTEKTKSLSKVESDLELPEHLQNTTKDNESTVKNKKPRKYKRIHIRRRKPGHGKPVETKIISEETITEYDDNKKVTNMPDVENKSPKVITTTTAKDDNSSKGIIDFDYTTTDNPTSVVSRIGFSATDVSTTKNVDQNTENIPSEMLDDVTATPTEVSRNEEFLSTTPVSEKKKRVRVVHRRKKHPKSTPSVELISEETTTHESSSEQTENISSTEKNIHNKEATLRFESHSTYKPKENIKDNLDNIGIETSTETRRILEEITEKMEKEFRTTSVRNRETSTESIFFEDTDDYPEADRKKLQEAFIKELIQDLEPENIKDEPTPSPFSGDAISTRILSPSAPNPTASVNSQLGLGQACNPNSPGVSGSSAECVEYNRKNANGTKPHFIAKSKKDDKINCYDVGVEIKQTVCPENTSNLPLIVDIHAHNEEPTTHSPYLIKISKLEKLLDMLCTKKLHRLRSKLALKSDTPRTTRRNNEIKYKLVGSSEQPETLSDKARQQKMVHYPNYRTIKRRALTDTELMDYFIRN